MIYTMQGDLLDDRATLAVAQRLAAERGTPVVLAEGYDSIVRSDGSQVAIHPDSEIIRGGVVYVATDAGETEATWIR
jgi:hypothetical protein